MAVTRRFSRLARTLCGLSLVLAACGGGGESEHEPKGRAKDAGRDSPRRDAGRDDDEPDDAGGRDDAGRGSSMSGGPRDAGPPAPMRIEDLLTPDPMKTFGLDTDPPHPVF